MPNPYSDPKAIIAILEKHAVSYVVIGGVAATLWGSPIPTSDLDVTPSTDLENLERLSSALAQLEAEEWDPRKTEYVEREWSAKMLAQDSTWLLGTKHGDVDLCFAPAGTGGYEDLRKRAERLRLGMISVPVISLEDLIRCKEAAGRQRDREHLPTLIKLLERRGRTGSS